MASLNAINKTAGANILDSEMMQPFPGSEKARLENCLTLPISAACIEKSNRRPSEQSIASAISNVFSSSSHSSPTAKSSKKIYRSFFGQKPVRAQKKIVSRHKSAEKSHQIPFSDHSAAKESSALSATMSHDRQSAERASSAKSEWRSQLNMAVKKHSTSSCSSAGNVKEWDHPPRTLKTKNEDICSLLTGETGSFTFNPNHGGSSVQRVGSIVRHDEVGKEVDLQGHNLYLKEQHEKHLEVYDRNVEMSESYFIVSQSQSTIKQKNKRKWTLGGFGKLGNRNV